MGKIKLSKWDEFFTWFRKGLTGKDTTSVDQIKIIMSLREQINQMVDAFESLDIVVKITNYRSTQSALAKFVMFSLDEERMRNELGYAALIQRLTNDRNLIFNELTKVKEIDLSEIKTAMRSEQLNKVLGND